ncbi:MAG: hypothetical protein ABEJ31_10775 [Haloarculaceae archaeon]
MRYKVAPEPATREALAEAHRALPLVPGRVDDCCAHLRTELGLATRDDASEWLAFLEALGLAVETDRGYRREQAAIEADVDDLGAAFRARVFVAAEVCGALESADEPLDPDRAFERVHHSIPTWERNRREDWESAWRDRVGTLLEWAVAFGLAERVDGEFVAAGA